MGNNGLILTTYTGGLSYVKKYSETVPRNFNLYQNYPNPFNPVTNVRFDIPRSSHVELIIYDALGRKVATLVNEKADISTIVFSFNFIFTGSIQYFP